MVIFGMVFQDHVLPANQNLKSLSIREFAALVFDVCPGLDQYKVREGWSEWAVVELVGTPG